MSGNYEHIKSAPSGGVKFRTIIILLLIAFIGGTISAGWAITKYNLFQTDNSNAAIIMDRDTVPNANETAVAAKSNNQSVQQSQNIEEQNTDNNNQSVNDLVDSLEGRLSPTKLQAQQISGNVSRTESMLIAFSARRAIDSGSALGYIENELRLKFSNSNPDDIRAIIDAGNNPVRLATLQNQLEIASDILLTPSSDATAWGIIKKEMGELFVVRKEGSQPPQADRRLARIKTALTSRDIKTAILEMEKMPGANSARDWIALAKRYDRVQKALDAIEKTAISIPSNILTIEPVIPQAGIVKESQPSAENASSTTGNKLN